MLQRAGPMISISGVSKSFDSAQGHVQALEPVTLDIEKGAFISIVGPSAAESRRCSG